MSQGGASLVACCGVRRGVPSRGVSHLLVAADALSADRWGGSHIAVCGAQVHPASHTAGEAEEDPRYCPTCVRAAVRWSATR